WSPYGNSGRHHRDNPWCCSSCRAADRQCKRPLYAAPPPPPPPAGAACNQAARGGARSGQAPLLAGGGLPRGFYTHCQGDSTRIAKGILHALPREQHARTAVRTKARGRMGSVLEIGTLPSRGERQQQAVIALHIWGLCLVLVPRQEWRNLPIDAQRSN